MQDDQKNTRKHPRTGAVFKVSYQGAERLADYTENMSETGLFIATDHELEVGEHIAFEISFPGLVKPIRLKGEVIWRRPREALTEGKPAGVGVDILFGSDLERKWLKDLITRFSQREDRSPSTKLRSFVLLLAEDNPVIRDMFSRALQEGLSEEHKLKLLQSSAAQETLDLLREERVDLLLIEHRMCRGEGVDVLETLAREKARPSVIVIGSSESEKKQALTSGADVFLKRPFPAKGLLATIRSLSL